MLKKRTSTTTLPTFTRPEPLSTSEEPKEPVPAPSPKPDFTFLQYLSSKNSVIARLCFSLAPPFCAPFNTVYTDLEGPTLSVFLLTVAIFHRLCLTRSDGGGGELVPALFYPTYFVIVFSIGLWLLSFITVTKISFRELICIGGYGMFGHCFSVIAAEICPTALIVSLSIFATLSSFRICGILFIRTTIPVLRFMICTPAAVMNTLFPIYIVCSGSG